jgi:putative redox protein
MKDSIIVNWEKGMAFEANVDGFKIKLDSKDEQGSKKTGPTPKPLMMVALAGCTGMDVVSILEKMRVELKDFTVKVEGDLTEDHPKHFIKMHIIYTFTGKDLPYDKLKKAVELSQERYCGVVASYRKAFDVSYEIKIIEKF